MQTGNSLAKGFGLRALRRGGLSFLLAIGIASGTAAMAVAQEKDEDKTEDWVKFHFDDKPDVPHVIAPGLAAGFELTGTADYKRNFDLDSAKDEDESVLDPELALRLLYDDGGLVRVYSEIEVSRNILLKSPDDRDPDTTLELKEANVTVFGDDRNVAATLGRWSESDEREWLFDEEVDGAQFVWRNGSHAVELMYAREELVKKDLLGERDDENPDWFYARYYGRISDDVTASLYALHGDGNDEDNASLTWIGGALAGEVDDTDFWIEAAGLLGEEQDDGEEVSVSGFGIDAGLTHTFSDVMFEPRVTLAAAFGSAGFRQTGVQGNSARFGGKTSIKYYGEVLDPELSNLFVLTLGTGVNVTDKTSVDFMYHHYRQSSAADELRDSAIDADPSGNSKHIGDGFDVVVGIREIENVDIDLVGGVFLPGDAFEDNDDAAWFGEVEVSVKF